MKSLKEQIAELRAAGYKALTAQAKVAPDAVLLAMHRSGFKLKSAIKGGVVMSSITGDIRRATMDMDIDFVHHRDLRRESAGKPFPYEKWRSQLSGLCKWCQVVLLCYESPHVG